MRLTLLLAFTLLAIAGHADGGRVFVTNERSDTVSVIDAATNQVIKTVAVGKRPRGIGISPDGSEVYVAVSGEKQDRSAGPRQP